MQELAVLIDDLRDASRNKGRACNEALCTSHLWDNRRVRTTQFTITRCAPRSRELFAIKAILDLSAVDAEEDQAKAKAFKLR